jgi:hypothetical protein
MSGSATRRIVEEGSSCGAARLRSGIETPRGFVEVWALGEDRFRITAPGHEQLVVGFDEAERTADELAQRLE